MGKGTSVSVDLVQKPLGKMVLSGFGLGALGAVAYGGFLAVRSIGGKVKQYASDKYDEMKAKKA